jgi:hypothetical protein
VVPRCAPAAAATPAALPLPAAPVFDPVAALDTVLAGASPDRKVSGAGSEPALTDRQGQDRLFRPSAHAGHVYIYLVGTEGTTSICCSRMRCDKDNRIGAM